MSTPEALAETIDALEKTRAKIIESPDNERILAWTVGVFLVVASAFVVFTGWYANQLDDLINVRAEQIQRAISCPK